MGSDQIYISVQNHIVLQGAVTASPVSENLAVEGVLQEGAIGFVVGYFYSLGEGVADDENLLPAGAGIAKKPKALGIRSVVNIIRGAAGIFSLRPEAKIGYGPPTQAGVLFDGLHHGATQIFSPRFS